MLGHFIKNIFLKCVKKWGEVRILLLRLATWFLEDDKSGFLQYYVGVTARANAPSINDRSSCWVNF